MIFKIFKNHTSFLIKKGLKAQLTNYKGEAQKPSHLTWIFYLFIILICIIISFNLHKASHFVFGYIIAALSILIGLFMSLANNIFNDARRVISKRESNDNKTENQNAKIKIFKNFAKSYTALLSFSALLAFIDLCLFIIGMIFTDLFNINITFDLILDNFILNFLTIFYRFISFFLFFYFVSVAIYGISSAYAFMQRNLD